MRTLIIAAITGLVLMISMQFQADANAAPAIIEEAKEQCVVGEQADGYLGIVTGKTASTDVRREVRRINQERKSVYAGIAKKNGVTEDVAAALTAEKLIARAPAGQCVRDSNGQWVQK